MKIALLGANGRTGKHVAQRATDAGHEVTALVRSAHSMDDVKSTRLEVRAGNVCDAAFLTEAIGGHDVLISTLGPRLPTKAACRIYTDSAAAIVAATMATGLNRILVTSTALLFPPEGFTDRILRLIAGNNYRAAASMEAQIRETETDWTFARVGFLTDHDDSGYREATSEMPEGAPRIPRLAVAAFLVSELANGQHRRAVVGLCGEE